MVFINKNKRLIFDLLGQLKLKLSTSETWHKHKETITQYLKFDFKTCYIAHNIKQEM